MEQQVKLPLFCRACERLTMAGAYCDECSALRSALRAKERYELYTSAMKTARDKFDADQAYMREKRIVGYYLLGFIAIVMFAFGCLVGFGGCV